MTYHGLILFVSVSVRELILFFRIKHLKQDKRDTPSYSINARHADKINVSITCQAHASGY